MLFNVTVSDNRKICLVIITILQITSTSSEVNHKQDSVTVLPVLTKTIDHYTEFVSSIV